MQDLLLGHDDSPVLQSLRPKTVSVEDSYFPRGLTTSTKVHNALEKLALEVIVKIRQDEVWYGPTTGPVVCVVTTRIMSAKYTQRHSRSTKLSFAVGPLKIPADSIPPITAISLAEIDRQIASRLASVAERLVSDLHPPNKPFEIVILNLGLKLSPTPSTHLVLGNDDSGKLDHFVKPKPEAKGEKSKGADSDVKHYYETSRLSFIGTWKRRFKTFMRQLRDDAPCDVEFQQQLKQIPKTTVSQYFLHIDVDAFFCSIALRSHSQLSEAPVAVASGLSDTSEICSANYLARQFGIHANMFVKTAKEKCPQINILKTCTRLFEDLTEASAKIHSLLLQITPRFKTVSCDEMYLQLEGTTDEPMPDAVSLAHLIRQWVSDKVGCSVSIGIAPSIVAARFATTRAKPPGLGIFRIANGEEVSILAAEPTSTLSGVGKSTARRLATLGANSCHELSNLPISTLQNEFGSERGKALHDMALGIDSKSVDLNIWDLVDKHSNTLQHDKNYGVRINSFPELQDLLKSIVSHLVTLLDEEWLESGHIGVRLSIRKPSAPIEPSKAGGCGACFQWNKSTPTMNGIFSEDALSSIAIGLAKQCTEALSDIRGVGVALTKLTERDRKARRANSLSRIDTAFNAPHSDKKRRTQTVAIDPKDIDETVLGELPKSIRNEVLAAMGSSPTKKKKQRINDFFSRKY